MDMQDDQNNSQALKIIQAIINGENPYLDVEDIEDLFDELLRLDQFDKAEILTRYALSLHPDSTEIMILRATLLTDLDRFNEAEQLLQYLLQVEKQDPDVYINYGWLRLKQCKINEALRYFDQAIQIESQFQDDDYLAYEIGMNLNAFDLPSKAEKYLRRFYKNHPDDPEGISELAYCLECLEKDEEAIQLFEKLVDIDPFNELGWYNLGVLYSKKNDFDAAIEAYQTAVDINIDYAEAYFNMGNIYMTQGHYNNALFAYTEYLSLTPFNWRENVAFQYLGECYEELEDWRMARKFFILSTNLTPQASASWYGLALAEIEHNDNEMAIMAISRALRLEPNIGAYYFVEAQAYMNLERYEDMLKSLLEGLKYDNNDILAWLEVLNVVSANNKNFDYLNFLNQMHSSYGESLALNFIEAYILFLYDHDDERIEPLLSTVALNYPTIIQEAKADNNIKKFLYNRRITAILDKFNIEL